MAVYKVPQDVEAEDKLLGPFSFKQFIFLIIAVMSLGLAYGLSRLLLPLAIIPLPATIFFIVLALPLRKDQPMEIYLAAVISFILKPKVRLWKPDGIESLIEVIAPPVDNRNLGKGYSQEEVQKRLSYLADIVDSRGWSVRGVAEPENSMQIDLYNEAQALDDPLDDAGSRSQKINALLSQQDNQRRQEILERMKQVHPNVAEAPSDQPTNPNINMNTSQSGNPLPGQPLVSPAYTPMSLSQPELPDEDIKLVVNPYPTMQQSVLTPISERAPLPPSPDPSEPSSPNNDITSSEKPVPPAIIDLANNKDRTIDSLQREADKIMKKEQQESEEVVISLR